MVRLTATAFGLIGLVACEQQQNSDQVSDYRRDTVETNQNSPAKYNDSIESVMSDSMEEIVNLNKFAIGVAEKVGSYTFRNPEVPPVFPGGWDSLYSYIRHVIDYPQTAVNDSLEGMVFIQFIVRKDSSIDKVEIRRGVREDLEQVCITAIRGMPKWTPGKLGDHPVDTWMILPIRFSLKEIEETDTETHSKSIYPDTSKLTPKKWHKSLRTNGEMQTFNFKVYPNPANGFCYLETTDIVNDLHYIITSMNGQTISSGQITSAKQQINLNGMSAGVYVVSIVSKRKQITKTVKLIIQQ